MKSIYQKKKNKLPEQDYISNDGSVLIVEDDRGNPFNDKESLSTANYSIIEASNGNGSITGCKQATSKYWLSAT